MSNKPLPDCTVLLFVRSPGNRKVLVGLLSEEGLESQSIASEQALDDALNLTGRKLALVDTQGFSPSIWKLCEKLRSNDVPFVVLSTPDAFKTSSQAIAKGAVSVIQKPVAKSALMQLLNGLKG